MRRKFLKVFATSFFSFLIIPFKFTYSKTKKIINKNLTEEQKNILFNESTERPFTSSLLNETRLKNEGYFDHNYIKKIWNEHLFKKKNWQHQLWDILMFQSWLDKEKN